MSLFIIAILVVVLAIVIYKSEKETVHECFGILVEGVTVAKAKADILKVAKAWFYTLKLTGELILVPFLTIALILFIIAGATYRAIIK